MSQDQIVTNLNSKEPPVGAISPDPLTQRLALINISHDSIISRAKRNNDGENMSYESLVERAKIIKDLSYAIDEWIIKHVPEGITFNQELLGALVQSIGETQKPLIDLLVSETNSISAYPSRPSIKIYEGVKGFLPDIWLLGWRENETSLEATEIHDHVDSEAAFHVYQGCVDEVIFTFAEEQWKKPGTKLNVQKTTRGLRRGSTATIRAPYVHTVIDHRDKKPAVTIHAYYPPLDAMNFYEEQDGILVPKGSWSETPATHFNCGSHCK